MEWTPGGAGSGIARMLHGLIHHLPACNVRARGLVTGTANAAWEAPVTPVASTSSPLPVRLWAMRRALKRAVDRQEPDLIAAHFALYTLPLLDRVASHPLVVHFHGPWALESEAEGEAKWRVRVKRWLERPVYHRASRCIVLSQAFRQILVREYGVPASRIRIVPGGVDVSRFDPACSRTEARDRLGWTEARPLVLTVRRLVQRTGLGRLVDAMTTVAARVPDVLLLIAGTGPLASSLQSRIEAAGLASNVRLVGFVPDDALPLAYRAADLSVVPTRSLEGFGLVAVESLAAGTPVLVTPVGGLPEIVTDLAPDLVLPDATAASLADGLVAALTGRCALPSPTACRSYATERYAWPTVASQVRNVYTEVL